MLDYYETGDRVFVTVNEERASLLYVQLTVIKIPHIAMTILMLGQRSISVNLILTASN